MLWKYSFTELQVEKKRPQPAKQRKWWKLFNYFHYFPLISTDSSVPVLKSCLSRTVTAFSLDTCRAENSERADWVYSRFQLEGKKNNKKTPTRIIKPPNWTMKLELLKMFIVKYPCLFGQPRAGSWSQTFTDPKNKRFLPGCIITWSWGAGTRASV